MKTATQPYQPITKPIQPFHQTNHQTNLHKSIPTNYPTNQQITQTTTKLNNHWINQKLPTNQSAQDQSNQLPNETDGSLTHPTKQPTNIFIVPQEKNKTKHYKAKVKDYTGAQTASQWIIFIESKVLLGAKE